MTSPLDPLRFLLLNFAGAVNQIQQEQIEYLKTENRVLREQLGSRYLNLNDKQRRRLAVKGKALGRKLLQDIAGIVSPDTILRWYRQLVANKYDGSKKRAPGRPRTLRDIEELVVTFAKENPTWGYTRIRDALKNLRHTISRTTVKRILLDNGIEPAPERSRKTASSTFIKSHFGELAAADFFTVEALTWTGLVRFSVLFVMDIETRRVHIAGITSSPTAEWMKQIARNLTDGIDGFLLSMRYLIIDRDPLFTHAFRWMLKDAGVEALRLPPRSPNLNAYCERFVLSIRRECLDPIVPLGEGHLRRAIAAYVSHYHAERHHQGLDGTLIDPDETAERSEGPVVSRSSLGGLLNYYYRDAA